MQINAIIELPPKTPADTLIQKMIIGSEVLLNQYEVMKFEERNHPNTTTVRLYYSEVKKINSPAKQKLRSIF